MSVRDPAGWKNHIEQIVRSKHYTWIGEGLGGEPLAEALTNMVTDIRHICAHEGVSWDNLLACSRAQFEEEEAGADHPDVERIPR